LPNETTWDSGSRVPTQDVSGSHAIHISSWPANRRPTW
jgi:hypothetical protein